MMNSTFSKMQRISVGAAFLLGSVTPSGATDQAEMGGQSAPPPAHATPAELVDALNGVFGKQAHGRAVHAKGIVLKGRFLPTSAAPGLSKAPHFQQAVPVTIRFSNFAGIPTVSDTDALASPRGLAIKFHLPDGSETDLVTHAFNGFPSPNADEFRRLFLALGASGPGVAKPTPADKYLAEHPVAKAFLTGQLPPPVSYATLNYYGVNSFQFTNAQGQIWYGRYRIEPEAGLHLLSTDETAKASPDYLAQEIHRRVAQAPIRFRMQVQLAEPGDKIDDPSIAWPESRKLISLGVLEITEVAESEAAERALIFLPAALPAGIAPADPMILARSEAYPVSYQRRHP